MSGSVSRDFRKKGQCAGASQGAPVLDGLSSKKEQPDPRPLAWVRLFCIGEFAAGFKTLFTPQITKLV